jgi:hypothetical protein
MPACPGPYDGETLSALRRAFASIIVAGPARNSVQTDGVCLAVPHSGRCSQKPADLRTSLDFHGP